MICSSTNFSSLGPECAAGGQESSVAMVVAVEGAAAVTRPVHRHYIGRAGHHRSEGSEETECK